MGVGKVLIIGSDVETTELLSSHFQSSNFDVQVARTGEEGLASARRFLPQAVVVDSALPDTDGASLCQDLRRKTPVGHVYIALLARQDSRREKLTTLEMGASDVIAMPFDAEEITLRVRNALRQAVAQNLTNPITGLPGASLIEEQLRLLLRGAKGWALLRVSVRGLSGFRELYGFLTAEEVLRSTARILVDVIEREGVPGDFIGHSGESSFIVLTKAETAQAVTEALNAHFDKEAPLHYSIREREQGFIQIPDGDGVRQEGLMKLDIRQITTADGPFYDIRSLTEALGA